MKYIWLILTIIVDIGVLLTLVLGWRMTDGRLPLEIFGIVVYLGIIWIMAQINWYAIKNL